MKKPRLFYAWQVVSQGIDNKELVVRILRNASDDEQTRLNSTDIDLLRGFLGNMHLKHCLELMDVTTSGASQAPVVSDLRPLDGSERDSLRALSELWVDLEQFVMQTRESDEPEAHELYDLLADPHIREVLVAYDDVANSRYYAEDFDLVSVYTELDSHTRRSTSRSPAPTRSTKQNSLHSGKEVFDDSLGEITVVSDLRSAVITHNNSRSSNRDSSGMPDDIETAELKKNPRSDEQLSHLSKTKSDDVKPDGDASRRWRDMHTGSPRDASEPEPTFSKKSSKQLRGAHERDRSLSRHRKTDERNHLGSQSDSETSPTSPASPKPDHRDLLGSASRRAHDLGQHHESTGLQSSKSHTRKQSQSTAKSLVRNTEESALSPTSKRTSTTIDLCQDGNHKPPLVSYPSASLPDRNHRHSRQSRSGEPEPPGSQTQSLTRRTSRQSTGSNKDVRPPRPGEIRIVKLRRDHPGEPIGITIAVRTPSPPPIETSGLGKHDAVTRSPPVLTIQRIMAGSLADRNGTLFPGDILLEFNGRPVSSLDQVHSMMQQTSSALNCDLTVKAPNSEGFLRPGLQYKHNPSKSKRYIRTFFDYDASRDSLLPTGDVGMSFRAGDVLELVDDQDPNWWQVRPLSGSRDKTRLIPSQTLEERRRAFNQEKAQATSNRKLKKKVKQFFRAADSSALRLRSDIWSYEEVVPWPQSTVPCLLLLGAYGVGRRTLKVLLASQEPNRFAYPISDTTDPSVPSDNFQVLSKAQMEEDVRSGAYVEWGKVDGHYYGIRFSAVRKIIASGRTAVLDCQPQSVHLLHQPEFNPCTVFIAAPPFEVAKRMLDDGIRLGLTKNARSDDDLRNIIEESNTRATQYRHLYTHLLCNSNMKETVYKLSRLVSRIEKQPSWIPSGWAYELSVPTMAVRRSNGTIFVPGSSSLSALGIQGLPPFRPSTITRSVLSGISEASTESASRLARPPSISSSAVLRDSDRTGAPENWRRLYEKRRKPPTEFRPLSPAIPEQDTSTESAESHAVEASYFQAPGHKTGTETRRPLIKPNTFSLASSNRIGGSYSHDSTHRESSLIKREKPTSPKASNVNPISPSMGHRSSLATSVGPGHSRRTSKTSKLPDDRIRFNHTDPDNSDGISSTSSEQSEEDEGPETERSTDLLV